MPPHRSARKGKRQRFYARNARKTTSYRAPRLGCSGHSMRSFRTSRADPPFPHRIHPALTSFADECCAMLARLIAYLGVLALLAMAGIHFWDQLPAGLAVEPSAR